MKTRNNEPATIQRNGSNKGLYDENPAENVTFCLIVAKVARVGDF